MAFGVPDHQGSGVQDESASTRRSTTEIAAELERLIVDAEAGGNEALVYFVRMALYEARRLESGADRDTRR